MRHYPLLSIHIPAEKLIRRGMININAKYIPETKTEIAPGTIIDILSSTGQFIGRGYYNSNSKIPLRILSFDDEPIDYTFLLKRFEKARKYRERFFSPSDSYRLIHAEADGLPGLVIDKFNRHYCVQITTYGMERLKPIIIDILNNKLKAESIFLLCDSLSRKKEGLEPYRQIEFGNPKLPLYAEVNAIRYYFDPLKGHKTGFFLDQQANRFHAAEFCHGLTVLDMFCYCGAFSIIAAHHGAAEVHGVDIFSEGLEWANQTAAFHHLESIVTFHREEGTEFMIRHQDRMFDVVFLDPPSLVRGYRRARRNLNNYKKLNRLALKLIKPKGMLITSICSYHVSFDDFQQIIGEVFYDSHRNGYIFSRGHAGFDHPVFPGRKETDYLKTFYIQLMD